MKRIIYVAGVNRKHLAAQADSVPYWLLSVTLLRKYPNWLAQYLANRVILWDPGTFSEEAISYHGYRMYLDRYANSQHRYFQYDEIGDAEVTSWYLRDMRRRGYNPIPIIQGAEHASLLRTEKLVGIGGLVRMNDEERRVYLDEIFYDHKPQARVHLLGMIQQKWFEPYLEAVQGDNTSWIPRSDWNRQKSVQEWMKQYGEQFIPHKPRQYIQIKLFA